jgi:hypothetical protein
MKLWQAGMYFAFAVCGAFFLYWVFMSAGK